jgi:hypothetical protein
MKNGLLKITSFSLLTGVKWFQIEDKDFIDLHQKWWIEKEELKNNLTGSTPLSSKPQPTQGPI